MKLAGKRFLRSYPYRDAYLLPGARQIRAAVQMPLILLGGITTRATMDLAMREGFQFVAMARALLREPDLINRIQADETTPSLCIHCNKCLPSVYRGTHCVIAGTFAEA
jgi:2,4-dienoyl-CoA reductase-like NADH-dependent reductase (Old Yellow Enzyme family)